MLLPSVHLCGLVGTRLLIFLRRNVFHFPCRNVNQADLEPFRVAANAVDVATCAIKKAELCTCPWQRASGWLLARTKKCRITPWLHQADLPCAMCVPEGCKALTAAKLLRRCARVDSSAAHRAFVVFRTCREDPSPS